MKVCVVGCGAAGIITAKHLSQANINFDVYEMTDDIGGTWIYTEKQYDSNGAPVHSSMYKNLRTNLPKEVMEFEGFKYSNIEKSFISSQQVYKYLKDFVNYHNLTQYIKLGHLVTNISKTSTSWDVTVKNLNSSAIENHFYDAIIVCNGHYYKPRYPDIDGKDKFKGLQLHAKTYRVPEIFKDKTVLVIGFGPSGQDITDDISKQAKKVFLSHHTNNFKAEFFKSNVVSKSDVKCFNQNSVSFLDGTTEDIDAVLYCTGYYYSFPFLDNSCDITVDDNYVRPLYKQLINIKHPSMYFIGLTFKSFIFPLFELQVKAIVKLLQSQKQLPTEESMLKELKDIETENEIQGIPKRRYHQLSNIKDYTEQVRSAADIEDLPRVIYDIYEHTHRKRYDGMNQYRKYVYKIINNNEFSVYKDE